ncbi:putative sulfite oxidase [Sarcoptes scabiei]|nr:putative sulfite oxidase [Sarcoptes scabiei]
MSEELFGGDKDKMQSDKKMDDDPSIASDDQQKLNPIETSNQQQNRSKMFDAEIRDIAERFDRVYEDEKNEQDCSLPITTEKPFLLDVYGQECLICLRRFEPCFDLKSILNCGHEFCFECSIRLALCSLPDERKMDTDLHLSPITIDNIVIDDNESHRDSLMRCPICKEKVQSLLVTDQIEDDMSTVVIPEKDPNDTNLWTVFDLFIYSNMAVMDEAINRITFRCLSDHNDCKQIHFKFPYNSSDLERFRNHLREKHNQFICTLCIEKLKQMPYQIEYFDEITYQNHLIEGENSLDGSMVKHRTCLRCESPQNFFDQDSLDEHCRLFH